jgi:hypothetical protein
MRYIKRRLGMSKAQSILIPALSILICSTASNAQVVEAQYSEPTLDRWMYPFNGSPGSRFEMTTFGAVDNEGFDDHDAQVMLGFDTSSEFMSGLGADQYRILEITVKMTVSNDDGFEYDDSYDPFDTYGVLASFPDTDPGRPINLFLPGYRDGYDQSTYFENTVFGLVPDVAPAQGLRHAFAAIFDTDGVATDISNNIKEQFDANPLAIGTTDAVTPGNLVPADTEFSFSFVPCDPASRAELERMLDRGEIRFMITSLAPASGGPDGGEGDYPIWYARENPLAQIFGYAAKLEIRARIGSAGDYNGDGSKNFLDVSDFLSDFGSSDPAADINGDCSHNFLDVSGFLSEYSSN